MRPITFDCLRALPLFLVSLTGMAGAQTPAPDPAKEPAKLSFVVLGQPVRKTYTIVGGNAGIDEVAAKPGDEPPSRVLWKAGDAVGETWLTPNVPSGSSEIKPGATTVELRTYVEPAAGKPPAPSGRIIANVPIVIPGKPQTAFILKKDPKANWLQELGVVSLPDDLASFPARSIRVLNASRSDLYFQIGEKKIQLPPGRNTNVPAPDAVVQIAAAVRQGDSYVPVVNTARKLRANDRLSLVAYDYDGERNPGETPPPVSGILISQPVPAEVPPPAPPTPGGTVAPAPR